VPSPRPSIFLRLFHDGVPSSSKRCEARGDSRIERQARSGPVGKPIATGGDAKTPRARRKLSLPPTKRPPPVDLLKPLLMRSE